MKLLIWTVIVFIAATITAISVVNRPGNTPMTALPIPSSTPSLTPEPTPIPPAGSPTLMPKTQKAPSVNPVTSPAPFGNAATPSDLNSTVNAYRSANSRNALTVNATLCRIAETRVIQQSQAGSLDNHAGFQGQAESQKEFLHVGEILQYRSPQESAAYLVYTGWAGSSEHNATLLDPGWTHGCGSTSGLFAVFIFGRN